MLKLLYLVGNLVTITSYIYKLRCILRILIFLITEFFLIKFKCNCKIFQKFTWTNFIANILMNYIRKWGYWTIAVDAGINLELENLMQIANCTSILNVLRKIAIGFAFICNAINWLSKRTQYILNYINSL